MVKIAKRILKFFIEASVVVLVIYGVFSAGGYLKAKKDAQKEQQQSTIQEDQSKEQKTIQEKKKLSQAELDDAMNNILAQYEGNNDIGIVYKNFSTGYRFTKNDNK